MQPLLLLYTKPGGGTKAYKYGLLALPRGSRSRLSLSIAPELGEWDASQVLVGGDSHYYFRGYSNDTGS